jgi:hypothetical protein
LLFSLHYRSRARCGTSASVRLFYPG